MRDIELEEKYTKSTGENAIIDVINNAVNPPEDLATQPDTTIEMICMSDIEIKPIEWLWRDRIALGKIMVMGGDPGNGKSQITASFAATVTKGLPFPGSDEPSPVGNVIFVSAEDDPADTIKPRLKAVGADVSLCHVLNAVRVEGINGVGSKRSFDLSKDIEELGKAISRIGNVLMIVIDPISAYLGKTDSHNNADMRALLEPLSKMAAEHNVAVILSKQCGA